MTTARRVGMQYVNAAFCRFSDEIIYILGTTPSEVHVNCMTYTHNTHEKNPRVRTPSLRRIQGGPKNGARDADLNSVNS